MKKKFWEELIARIEDERIKGGHRYTNNGSIIITSNGPLPNNNTGGGT
jgi:hypothetical protein